VYKIEHTDSFLTFSLDGSVHAAFLVVAMAAAAILMQLEAM
jgi:hypothetical protein